MTNDIDTGTVTWTFHAIEGMTRDVVEDAVRRSVARLNHRHWTVTSEDLTSSM